MKLDIKPSFIQILVVLAVPHTSVSLGDRISIKAHSKRCGTLLHSAEDLQCNAYLSRALSSLLTTAATRYNL